MKLVDGKKLSREIIDAIKQEMIKNRQNLSIGVIQAGKDKASDLFIKQKQKLAEELGIDFKLFHFSKSASNRSLRKSITEICRQKKIGGVLIQLPLPRHLNTQYLLDAIIPEKDVDVLCSYSLGRFYTGKAKIFPPVVSAVLRVLERHDIKVEAQHIVIVGGGFLVGKPLAIELLRQGATITVLNSKTPSLEEHTKKADILISGTGKPKLIKSTMIKKGAVVFDVGSGYVKEAGKDKNKEIFSGDIDPEGLNERAGLFCPARGGIGPITVAFLMENLIKLKKQESKIYD